MFSIVTSSEHVTLLQGIYSTKADGTLAVPMIVMTEGGKEISRNILHK